MTVTRMPVFSNDELNRLFSWVTDFYNEWFQGILVPVRRLLRVTPPRLDEIGKNLREAIDALRHQRPEAHHLPLIRAAVTYKRRRVATDVERRKRLTEDRAALLELDKLLKPLDATMGEPWFLAEEAAWTPLLSDFLTVQIAEEQLLRDSDLAPQERVYDEKFGILTSPALFFPDLRYYRATSELRGRSVTVAFCDIDDLKSFNTRYTEPIVDRDLLPRFMNALESHMYARGHAYRQGGDEYVLLLPGMTKEEAVQSLAELQDTLDRITYTGIERNPTISIGLFELSPGSDRTDQEALELASIAKKFAKDDLGNRICGYKGTGISESDLDKLHIR